MILANSFDIRYCIIGMLAQASVMFNFVSLAEILNSSVGCTPGDQFTGMVVDYPYN